MNGLIRSIFLWMGSRFASGHCAGYFRPEILSIDTANFLRYVTVLYSAHALLYCLLIVPYCSMPVLLWFEIDLLLSHILNVLYIVEFKETVLM